MTSRSQSRGGMTGATGDLTPDDEDEAFVPAERREISDPEHQGDVTAAHGPSAPAQHGDIGSPGESHDGGGERHRRHADGEHRRSEGDGDEFGEHEDHF